MDGPLSSYVERLLESARRDKKLDLGNIAIEDYAV